MRALSLAALALAGCASSFLDRRLATISEDARVDVPVVFSADGTRAAWVERVGETSRVRGPREARVDGLVC